MRFMLTLVLLSLLVLPSLTTAQDGWQTYTDANDYSFSYPVEWFLVEKEDSVVIANFEAIDSEIDAVAHDFKSNEIAIEISFTQLDDEQQSKFLNSADFWGGTYMGFYAILHQATPKESYRVEVDYSNFVLALTNDSTDFRIITLVPESQDLVVLIQMATPLGEFDQHEATIMTILESVSLPSIVAAPTTASPLSFPTNTPPPPSTVTPVPPTMYINTISANVYNAPGENNAVVGTVNLDNAVYVVGAEGEWSQITYGTLMGWVYTPLLSNRMLEDNAEHLIKNTRGTVLSDNDVERVIANELVVTLRFELQKNDRARQANSDFTLIACNLWANGFTYQTFQFTATMSGGQPEAVEMILPPTARELIDCENPESVSMALYAERYDIHPELQPTPNGFEPTTAPPSSDFISEESLLTLVEWVLIGQEVPLTSITRAFNTIIVTALSSHPDYPEDGNYQIIFIGVLSGALAEGYTGGDLEPAITDPQDVIIEFKSGSTVVLRVTIQFQDMISFIDSEITAEQFFASWVVQ